MKKGIRDYLRILVRHFYVVVLIMILAFIGSVYYTNSITNIYEAESVILLDYEGNYNYEKLKTYVSYITTKDILNEVSTNLSDEETIELEGLVSANLVKDTNLIKLQVKYKNDRVVEISNELYRVFEKKIKTIYPNLKVYMVEEPSRNILNTDSVVVISLVASFIGSSLLVMIFGSANVNIKNHEDLKKYLSIKSLGFIPNTNENDNKKKKKNTLTNINILNQSSSLVSESYRMVRTNLDFLDLKVINFTSTSVSEGKSETVSNIALSFSMIGKKVLLIDCDLRKPKIHKNFNLNRALGLTDILIYNRIDDYQNAIQEFKVPNKDYKIDVLSAGSKVSNPSELLSSNRFKELIDKLKEEYDLILIDCPPVSLMADAVIVSKIASGTAYIIEYDRMNCATINKCIEQLNDVNANVLGGIITKLNINKQKNLYGESYEHYYSNYLS